MCKFIPIKQVDVTEGVAHTILKLNQNGESFLNLDNVESIVAMNSKPSEVVCIDPLRKDEDEFYKVTGVSGKTICVLKTDELFITLKLSNMS